MRSVMIILALSWSLAGLGACDSTVTTHGAGGAGGGTGTGSPLVPACPATPPSAGSPCSEPVRCEYGDDVDFSCNIVMLCEVSGVWSMQQDGQGGSCPSSPDSCNGTPAGSCDSLGEECEIDLGMCTCATVIVAPGQVTAELWQCADPDPACPPWPDRPIIGSPCSVPDLLCEYQPCTHHLAFWCVPDGGYWSDAFGIPCAY